MLEIDLQSELQDARFEKRAGGQKGWLLRDGTDRHSCRRSCYGCRRVDGGYIRMIEHVVGFDDQLWTEPVKECTEGTGVAHVILINRRAADRIAANEER